MRPLDFSVLISRKAFVEALGLDFCPAALSQGLYCRRTLGKASQQPNGLGLGEQREHVERGTGRQMLLVLFKP